VRVALAYVVLCFLWSTTWIGIKVGLHGAPPLIGAGVRFLLAGAVFAAWRAARGESLRVPREHRPLVVTTALLMFAFPYALVYAAETRITSGLTAVFFGTLPLYAALLAARLLPTEPLSGAKLGGIALGIAGLVVVFHGALKLSSAPIAIAAMAGMLVAPFFTALAQVLGLRWRRSLPVTLLLAWSMVLGGAVLLAVGLAAERRYLTLDARTLGSVAYLAVAGSVLGFALLFFLLDRVGAVPAALLNLVLPILALLEGALVYGEPLNASLAIGSAIVAAGVGVASLDRLVRRTPAAARS
jgi:drug/metabolite transporter (DMT)-like permease